MAKNEAPGIVSIENAWNSVALEERLELVARAQAYGTISAVSFVLLMGSVGYGLDMIYILFGGLIGSMLVMPLFASYSWRREKPAAILSYLAVRSVARRYAYGFQIHDLDIIIIFRGRMQEKYESEELEMLNLQNQSVDFAARSKTDTPVWICLMRGGLVILSEKRGGAKLEFVTPLNADAVIRKPQGNELEEAPDNAVVVEGTMQSRGRRVIISSKYKAALYVFEKHTERLIDEMIAQKERLEQAMAASRTIN